jgi:GTPase SAR1 family protein
MKEEIFIYFIGTAGSGKSTLTHTVKKWADLRDIDAISVNLDPGAENLPYEPDIDIRDWISLREIMESYNLGPNGAQIACADMVALNIADIKKSIESFKTNYVLIDTPGQLELFVFRESGKHIVQFLNPQRTTITYLVDHALAQTPSGFVAQLLLSLSTNFRLNLPQINILSKSDMLSREEMEKVILWSTDAELLYTAINNEDATIYREMSEEILHVIQNFHNHIQLIPTGKTDFFGIEDLYTTIQLQFKGGEDLMKD